MQIRLSDEQAELLKLCAVAYRQPVYDGQKTTIMFYTAGGVGTMAQHAGLPDAAVEMDVGDLEELEGYGLVSVNWQQSLSGSFRVTNSGYEVLEQMERQEQARASARVVPDEGAKFGVDWETQVFPVLRAVNELWSRNPASPGVSQDVINIELGREAGDPSTSVVLRKLEEADYIRTTMEYDQVDGPAYCEPTIKTFELLSGWPTKRGDAALARLIAALEQRIEISDNPEEKSRLKSVIDAVGQAGQEIMVGVLTNVITSGNT